ncbi:UDP-4-amino-4,6-dideoxy-N-acetyl-beta-L-altrosamine transaminase [Alphaproteobacteria bacterium]|nr:UDP-4-amino-4,6-dideoxy-N-acetyl-beta-L-altrosamine transaminase [Alphaproteobacteria bacterium]
MIPYSRQSISDEDKKAVLSVLDSDFLTQGRQVPLFEQSFCNEVSSKYAVASNSATSALHIACLALGVGKKDIVWTSPISFVASSNCAIYCGASVDFVDIDPKTYNISIESLENKLISAKVSNKLPSVLIPVHLAGQSCDMKAIHALSKEFGFKIIEDASHATGAKYLDLSVGSCRYSDICVFSFHPVKIITSGEGGMAVTNKKELSLKMGYIRSHGITRDPNLMTIEPDGPWFYQQLQLGFNYRMTDIQAALGNSQLKKLKEFVKKRQAIATIYNNEFSENNFVLPFQHHNSYSSFHLYIMRFKDQTGPHSRNNVFNRLRESGVNVNIHYIPIYRQPFYQSMGFKLSNFKNAEAYYKEAISIPLYPDLTESQQSYVIDVIKSSNNKQFKEGYQDLF